MNLDKLLEIARAAEPIAKSSGMLDLFLQCKPIPDWPRFFINNDGTIMLGLTKCGKKMYRKKHTMLRGYLRTVVRENGNYYGAGIHRLVLTTWGSYQPWDGRRYHVDHIDGVRDNNHIDNLRWLTAGDNRRAGIIDRGGTKINRQQYAIVKRCKGIVPAKDLGILLNVSDRHIQTIWEHGWTSLESGLKDLEAREALDAEISGAVINYGTKDTPSPKE